MIKFAVLRCLVLIFVSFLLGFGSACQRVLDTGEAKKNPKDVLLKSLNRSLNYKSSRIEALYYEDLHDGLANSYTETLEYLLLPDKSDKWRFKAILLDVDENSSRIYEAIEIGDTFWEKKSGGGWVKSSVKGSVGIRNPWDGELPKYLLGLEFAIRKTDVKFVGEETQDGINCVVFEYVAPGPYLTNNPKHRAWVGVSDGLLRKILIEGEHKIFKNEKASETISFSYDDKNMKIEPPI